MPLERFRLFALQMVFGLNAAGIAVWFPRIPDVKAALDLDVLTLSFCLFGLPAGTMTGFLLVGRVTLALGLRRTCLLAGSGFLLAFILPALAGTALLLGLALYLAGLIMAQIEVAMNAKASQMERVAGRRLMTAATRSGASARSGALIGGAFAEADLSFATQQLIVQPLFAAASFGFASLLLPTPGT